MVADADNQDQAMDAKAPGNADDPGVQVCTANEIKVAAIQATKDPKAALKEKAEKVHQKVPAVKEQGVSRGGDKGLVQP